MWRILLLNVCCQLTFLELIFRLLIVTLFLVLCLPRAHLNVRGVINANSLSLFALSFGLANSLDLRSNANPERG